MDLENQINYKPPPTPTTSLSKPPGGGKSLFFLLSFLTFAVGITLGYFFYKFNNSQQELLPRPTPSSFLTLPKDAVQIQSCANNKGTLYVKPQDIPVGPVYMVNKNQVIGIEFMLSKDELVNGKSFKYLSGLNAKVDHVNIGLLSQGHEGYTSQHYHVDLYLVPREVEEGIACATGSTLNNMPMTDISTQSASPKSRP